MTIIHVRKGANPKVHVLECHRLGRACSIVAGIFAGKGMQQFWRCSYRELRKSNAQCKEAACNCGGERARPTRRRSLRRNKVASPVLSCLLLYMYNVYVIYVLLIMLMHRASWATIANAAPAKPAYAGWHDAMPRLFNWPSLPAAPADRAWAEPALGAVLRESLQKEPSPNWACRTMRCSAVAVFITSLVSLDLRLRVVRVRSEREWLVATFGA